MCITSTFALNYLTSHVILCSRILPTSMEKNPTWEVVGSQLVDNFPHFMELEGSLPRTQELATFANSKPNEVVPIVSLSDCFNIILPSTSWSSKYLYIWFSHQNRVCIPLHTFHTHRTLLDFTAPVSDAEYKTWSSAVYNPPETCYSHYLRIEQQTLFGKGNVHVTQCTQFRQLLTRFNFCWCFTEPKGVSFVVGGLRIITGKKIYSWSRYALI